MASRIRRTRNVSNKRLPKSAVVLIVFASLIVVGFGAAFATAAIWLQDLPNYEDASAYNVAEKTKVYASDGETLLAEFYLENREPVELNQISPYVTQGTVATEDERFYDHDGIDLMGILRALVVNITGTGYEGASTITQQFVRNTVLADEATDNSIKRKVREAYIALQLEKVYSKDEILLMYLNTINYGQGAYGIEAAARLYFSKTAADVTLAEAAALVGIPQAPTNNNPIDNPERCTQRRNLVLDRMLTNGVITQEEHDAAQAEPLVLNISQGQNNDGLYQYEYFTSYVRETLLEQFSVDEVFKGGMRVITTLDIAAQEAAEEAVNRELNTQRDEIEIALVSVDNATGYINAMVGGRDYRVDEFNLATQARRQPGSSFKTFTLAAAMNEGISPETYVDCSSHVTIGNWEVSNIGGANYGTRTIRSAFAVSSNTGFARLITEIGADKVVEMAETLGIETDLAAYPSLTLGSEEVTVREMAQAYSTIASGGIRHQAVPIREIYDREGNKIYEADTEGEQVVSTELTQALTDVMEGVVTSGTGTAASFYGQPIAGKTGTSEEYRDQWFCGFTPQYTTALWIGGRTEITLPGSADVTSVFRNYMSTILAGVERAEFPSVETELEYTITDLGYGSTEYWAEQQRLAAEAEAAAQEEAEAAAQEQEQQAQQTPGSSTGTTGATGGSNSGGSSSGGATGGNTGGTGVGGGTGGSGTGGGSGTTGGTGTGTTGGTTAPANANRQAA